MNTHAEAAALIASLANGCNQGTYTGSMSTTIYDTAWVSMVSKEIDGARYWLFPESFQLILDSQLPEGGWQMYASEIDELLNSMAALLSLMRHQKEPATRGCPPLPADIDSRIATSVSWLADKLRLWDVESSDHVGFEMLVPSLLELLEQEGIHFQYPGSKTLAAVNAKKMAKFHPKMIYGPVQTTLIHSLEALIGKIDFNKVRHQRKNGSMLGSPASTSAYLIYGSSWDDDAEAYLRSVLKDGPGNGSGAFPSAFPSPIFETTWVRMLQVEPLLLEINLYSGTHNSPPSWVYEQLDGRGECSTVGRLSRDHTCRPKRHCRIRYKYF
jgi:hypothetical protein